MGQIGTTPIDANRSMLGTLGRKMLAGSKLSLSENLMALFCICGGNSRFLFRPDTMVVKTLELPESVKACWSNTLAKRLVG